MLASWCSSTNFIFYLGGVHSLFLKETIKNLNDPGDEYYQFLLHGAWPEVVCLGDRLHWIFNRSNPPFRKFFIKVCGSCWFNTFDPTILWHRWCWLLRALSEANAHLLYWKLHILGQVEGDQSSGFSDHWQVRGGQWSPIWESDRCKRWCKSI